MKKLLAIVATCMFATGAAYAQDTMKKEGTGNNAKVGDKMAEPSPAKGDMKDDSKMAKKDAMKSGMGNDAKVGDKMADPKPMHKDSMHKDSKMEKKEASKTGTGNDAKVGDKMTEPKANSDMKK